MSKNIKAKEANIISEQQQEDEIEEAKTYVKTEIIENNQISTKYTDAYGTVLIKNESNKELTQEVLEPNIQLNDTKDILIFHTHTCESYTQSEAYNYEATGNYRTIKTRS